MFNFSAILKKEKHLLFKNSGNPNHDSKGRFAKADVQKELTDLGIDKQYDADVWHKTMGGVTPKEFFGAYLGAENVTKENMSSLKGTNNYDGIHFHLTSPIVYGKKAEKIERRLFFKERTAKHDLLKFGQSKQGGGIAKKVLEASMRLYPKMGIDKVKLFAGLDLGAYTWGKFGFKYQDTTQAEGHSQQVYENIMLSTRAIGKQNLTPESRKELADIVKILDSGSLEGNQLLSSMKTPHLDTVLKPLVSARFPEKGTAMKLFMADTNYDGVLDMKNKDQMATFKQYIKH